MKKFKKLLLKFKNYLEDGECPKCGEYMSYDEDYCQICGYSGGD